VTPYYDDGAVCIYHGDAREILPSISAESIITDPVWPNSVFGETVPDPKKLLNEVLDLATMERAVIHLGCNSDVRFLSNVPERWKFIRVCSLEYAMCGYQGRVLYTGDIAYVFGKPPKSRKGAVVLPGKVMATSQNGRLEKRGTGRRRHKSKQTGVYDKLLHPAVRHLQHVRWLAKWFGGSSVVDPFGGSGTTGLACKALGIPCTLIEIEERFCELAVKRLGQAVLELVECE
jgi:hypothetical protein